MWQRVQRKGTYCFVQSDAQLAQVPVFGTHPILFVRGRYVRPSRVAPAAGVA
jgi:hypothetical protein